MGLIFPRAAFSKSAIKTLASKWEQGSRSLGCSGTMFRRDGPRFPHGTGLVPEQNFIISVFISLFILVPLAALQNPRCFPCDLADFVFGASFRNIRKDFSLRNRACSGTLYDFLPRTFVFRDILLEFRAGVPGENHVASVTTHARRRPPAHTPTLLPTDR